MLRSVWASAAAGLFAGVFAAKFAADFLPVVYAAVILLLIILFFAAADCRRAVVCVLVMFIGGNIYFSYKSDITRRAAYKYTDRYTEVTARICETPYCRDGMYRYTAEARSMSFADGEKDNVCERMKISCKKEFKFGDTVVFRGFVREYKPELNPLRFDSRLYNETRGIYFRMYGAFAEPAAEAIKDKSLSFAAARLRDSMCSIINRHEYGDKAALMCAVLTGNKNGFSNDFDELLLRSGTRRYLYSARIHFVLLVLLLGFLTRSIKKGTKDILYIAVFVVYGALNGSNPVFAKVFVLGAAGILYLKIKGIDYFPDVIGITVLICGLSNPLILLDAGFITAVCATIVMRIFYKWIYEGLMLRLPHLKILRPAAVWLAVSIGLTPVSALLFHAITPYSIFVTGIYTAAVGCVYLISPLYFILSAVFGDPSVGGWMMNVPVYAMLYIPRLLARLPYSYILIARPSAVFLAGYYSLLLAWRYNKRARLRNVLLCAGAGMFISFSVLQCIRAHSVYIRFVDVGQGDAQIIQMPYRKTILIDGGGSAEYTDYDVGKYEYLPYLLNEGIIHADMAFVSHYHKDHVMGIVTAMQNIRVDTLYLPVYEPDNEYRLLLEKTAAEHGVRIEYINDDMKLEAGGAELNIYAPRCTDGEDMNDKSVVMRFEYGGFSALFTGDITSKAEAALIEEGIETDADILKAPHHGSKYSMCNEFIEAVSPETVVFEAGEDNQFGFPTDEVTERCREHNIGMLCTAKQGDIVVQGTKSGIVKIMHH